MTGAPLRHLYSGKVRELFEAGEDTLLMVASDRISAFDVIMDDPITDKGRVLTGLSSFWFEATRNFITSHFLSANPADFPDGTPAEYAGRAMLVRETKPVRMECVVRGYLFGSAWSEYSATGSVHGTRIPAGLREAERLGAPIFTPTSKAESGHDEPLTDTEGRALVGAERFDELSALSIGLYEFAAEHAQSQGVLLADTKFEFGEVPDGSLVVIDEIFTPDSSRYWPADEYSVGMAPPSFDKQFVRDFLDSTGWDHSPPPPRLTAEVIAGTRSRYIEAYERITGLAFSDWYSPDSASQG